MNKEKLMKTLIDLRRDATEENPGASVSEAIGTLINCVEFLLIHHQPERSKREDLKKCVICECERPVKEVPNSVCCDCSQDSSFSDSF